MSNDNAGGLLSNPLPIVMVALLAAGVLIKQVPLQSARPIDSERVKFVPASQQDVEARLWQDPFAAVEKQEERSEMKRQEERSGAKTHTPESKPPVLSLLILPPQFIPGLDRVLPANLVRAQFE